MEWQVVVHMEMDGAAPLKPARLAPTAPTTSRSCTVERGEVPAPSASSSARCTGCSPHVASEEPWLEVGGGRGRRSHAMVRMDGRANLLRLAAACIIADQVGYGKTAITIGCIMSNQIQWPKPAATSAARWRARPASIPTKATLVHAPSQLLRQWPREVEKFSKRGKLNVGGHSHRRRHHPPHRRRGAARGRRSRTSVLRSPLSPSSSALARLAGELASPHCEGHWRARTSPSSCRDCLGSARAARARRSPGALAPPRAEQVSKGSGKMDDVKRQAEASKGRSSSRRPPRLRAARKASRISRRRWRVMKLALKQAHARRKAKSPASPPARSSVTKRRSPSLAAPKLTPPRPRRSRRSRRRRRARAMSLSDDDKAKVLRRDTPRRASLAVKYVEDADRRRGRLRVRGRGGARRARRRVLGRRGGQRARRRAREGGQVEEAHEGDAAGEGARLRSPATRTTGALDTRAARGLEARMTSPAPRDVPLRARVVVDEFTLPAGSRIAAWCTVSRRNRAGASPARRPWDLAEIKDTAALLGTSRFRRAAPVHQRLRSPRRRRSSSSRQARRSTGTRTATPSRRVSSTVSSARTSRRLRHNEAKLMDTAAPGGTRIYLERTITSRRWT